MNAMKNATPNVIPPRPHTEDEPDHVTSAIHHFPAHKKSSVPVERTPKFHLPDAAKRLWDKRIKFHPIVYILVFIAITIFTTLMLEWSVLVEPKVPNQDQTLAGYQSVKGQLTFFVTKMWLFGKYQFILNILVLGLAYLVLILLINRFWIASAIFTVTALVFSVANKIKVPLRNESVVPSDLHFIAGGTGGKLLSFVPENQKPLVVKGVLWLVLLIAVCVLVQFADKRKGIIETSWRHPTASKNVIRHNLARLVSVLISLCLLLGFSFGLGTEGSLPQRFAHRLSDFPVPSGEITDAYTNGPAITFLRLLHTKVMERPRGYSKATMTDLVKRYSDQAQQINTQRSQNLTDNTVIMVLSESFSDPLRVPGISYSEDPMPNIRQLESTTTSGLMLSAGYGGGTANMEYQAFTGLSMANFDPSFSSAYQQLVPRQRWTPSLNQLWNQAHGPKSSIALHGYSGEMYFRNTIYPKKYKFSKFYAADGPNTLKDVKAIDSAPYASDESLYDETLKRISPDSQQFLQVVTIQNHSPYSNWYADNQFANENTSTANLDQDEKSSIDTYVKGVDYTDSATQSFLDSLNAIDKPITVLWYGDHLPGIYDTAYADPANTLALHQTDYFIWSNAASASANTKLPDTDAKITSPNYFPAQLAEHLNAKVSPYLAFLTLMHQSIAATGPAASGGNNDDQPVYLDANGAVMAPDSLNASSAKLLHDYQLIQYDMTAGKGYLKDTDFLKD